MGHHAHKLDALSRMTVANGCTPAEAASAQAKLEALQKRERAASAERLLDLLKSDRPLLGLRLWRDEVLAKSEKREKPKIYREFKRREDLLIAQLTLVAEVRRRHRSIKRAEAAQLVNAVVEKLLSGKD